MSKSLTDMEAIALGVIARHAPCTAYKVQQSFLDSPSRFFSGSAGAIYPLVNRMKERGLVDSIPSSRGRRKSELLSLSERGRSAFTAWLYDMRLASDAGFDPVRARLSVFPDSLGEDSWRTYLRDLHRVLADRLRSIDAGPREHREAFPPTARALELERAALAAKVDLITGWLSVPD
jgi:DNA-binding PadR family transcriptional regulator